MSQSGLVRRCRSTLSTRDGCVHGDFVGGHPCHRERVRLTGCAWGGRVKGGTLMTLMAKGCLHQLKKLHFKTQLGMGPVDFWVRGDAGLILRH